MLAKDKPQAWHTPSTLAGAKVGRFTFAPVSLLGHVGHALSLLTEPENWDAIGVPIDDVLEVMNDMLTDWYSTNLIGMVSSFVGVLPTGWFALDGGSLVADDYPELASIVPSSWIVGNNIELPDMAARTIIGEGGGHTLADLGGVETVTLAIGQIPSHTHEYIPPAFNLDVEGPGVPDVGATVVGTAVQTGARGGGEAHNNMPPYLVLKWAIFAGRE